MNYFVDDPRTCQGPLSKRLVRSFTIRVLLGGARHTGAEKKLSSQRKLPRDDRVSWKVGGSILSNHLFVPWLLYLATRLARELRGVILVI